MNLYEFTFIAQQNLLRQEVEQIVQELVILLKNIKADIISQVIKGFIERRDGTVTKQQLEASIESIKNSLIVYSDFLKALTEILWIELENFSNLKEIKSKVDKEFKSKLSDTGITQDLRKLLGTSERIIKSAFICNIASAFKKNISHLVKILQEVLKSFKIVGSNQSSKTLEELLKNIEASGLIKYEY